MPKDKIILVTGAAGGIGRSICKKLAISGARLIIADKNLKELEKTASLIEEVNNSFAPILINFDQTNFDMIPSLAENLYKKFGKLDGLILNAAMLGELMPITHYSPKLWHETFNTNLHANFYLLSGLEFLFKNSSSPRLVAVSDYRIRSPQAYFGAYQISKLAFQRMIEIYALEVTNPAFKVNIVEIKQAATNLAKKIAPGIDINTLPHPDELTDIFIELVSENCHYHNNKIVI